MLHGPGMHASDGAHCPFTGGRGGRTVRGAVLIPEGRQFESPNRHVKITTAEVPLSKALNPYHELCSMKYAGPGCKQVSRYLVQFTLGNQRTLLCFALCWVIKT